MILLLIGLTIAATACRLIYHLGHRRGYREGFQAAHDFFRENGIIDASKWPPMDMFYMFTTDAYIEQEADDDEVG